MDLAAKIDHTLLKPEATEKDIVRLCHEAVKFRFATVCVNPVFVRTAAKLLYGSGVGVACVIGFPLGATLTEIKVQEIFAAKAHGAKEVDAVINIGAAKSGAWDEVEKDLVRVVEAAHCCNLVIKIIIETSLLTEEEKQQATRLVLKSGADYIKTSTGFAGGGATVDDVKNMKAWSDHKLKVKASGGIRSKEDALAMVEAGADRLGTSSGVKIVEG